MNEILQTINHFVPYIDMGLSKIVIDPYNLIKLEASGHCKNNGAANCSQNINIPIVVRHVVKVMKVTAQFSKEFGSPKDYLYPC
jgi:hypothetical protein